MNQTIQPASNPGNKKNTAAIVLGVLLAGLLAYTVYSSLEHTKLTDALEKERTAIAQDLDNMVGKYEEAIAQNTTMSEELTLKRDKIVALRDSVKGLKATNYNTIRRYRRQITALEAQNRKLFFINDSLAVANQSLSADLNTAQQTITTQTQQYDDLTATNQALSEKVAIGSVLKVNDIKVVAMRERSSGKMTETRRSRITDAFRVMCTIAENKVADKQAHKVYIQVADAQGNTVASKGEHQLLSGEKVAYSDVTTVDYEQEALEILSLITVDRVQINKGVYTVNVYVEAALAASAEIRLK
ncbi:MAG: hypothetical protein QGH06_01485 [Lutibacter sp.]|nr:hypothetical protein [Lutibacter sp.]